MACICLSFCKCQAREKAVPKLQSRLLPYCNRIWDKNLDNVLFLHLLLASYVCHRFVHFLSITMMLSPKQMFLSFGLVLFARLSFSPASETASVPDAVKAELLQRIRSFLMSFSLW
ncbi:unnamed protein product [Triticum turgidum subsp. durum]|uniref:Uncharacterized protein n=1 Tax=Triticum turgidum subsp. durum TaxID=4567 RepID=A0A9R1QW98_TRITD|nr:unnamed protein product [Triticum turgidum subsp. durum]